MAAVVGPAVSLAAAMVSRWSDLDRLLKAVPGLPLSTVFARLPARFKRQLSGSLFARRLGPEGRDTPYQHLSLVRRHTSLTPELERKLFGKPDDYLFPAEWLAKAAAYLLRELLAEWKDRIPATEDEAAPARADGKTAAPAKPDAPGKAWVEPAERFVAVAVAIHAGRYLTWVRYLWYAAAAAAVSLLVAAGAYNFQPEQRVMGVAAVTVGVVLTAGVYVLYRLNKNEIVSYVTGTDPGKFNLNATFLVNTGLVALPLLGTAAIQLSGRAKSLIEPVLDVIR